MSDLRSWYRAHLAGPLAELEEARRALAGGSPRATEAIRRLAHSLHGSGGTYGFPEISDAAVAVEEAADGDLPAPLSTLIETVRQTVAVGDNEVPSVLIVDDDPILTHLIRHHLTAHGMSIVIAHSAAEANVALRQHNISLIILDMVLPDADGRHLLSAVREHPGTASTPVIVVTARKSAATREECLSLGANAFLQKPFEPASLIELVTGILNAPEMGGALESADA